MIRSFQQSSTSGAGPILRQVGTPILVGLLLAGTGTSSNTVIASTGALCAEPVQNTSCGGALTGSAAFDGGAVTELRRISGLSWSQIARLFGVTPRSIHLWASGKPASPTHEEHLARVLAFVRTIDRGDSSANRAEILKADSGGTLLFDLLAAGSFAGMAGTTVQTSRTSRRKSRLDPARVYAPRPDELVNAEQDSIHLEKGASRAARSVKVRSGH
jgi:DNA-binding transcriptional regulator YiaG